ncbi:MAG: hypothetical protein CVU39_26240 [Chloroflexi bacterium HGW-Chloroflexi-10]|nr:MAG: hypothetical protein CVU39_26240 [Chloroflexi bacterium HGW-Chloroflexi-10]
MKKNLIKKYLVLGVAGIMFLTSALLVLPGIQNRLSWRWELANAYLRGVINPVSAVPTALPTSLSTAVAAALPTTQPSSTVVVTPTPVITEEVPTPEPTASPTQIPQRVLLPEPKYELQDINNCGPAALAMYLRFYGWEGDQFAISDVIKPIPQDRNVNVDELDYYVRNFAGWLQTLFRVGGTPDLLKALIAEGIPVMIEETFHFDENNWPNDDRWAGHYLLITGFDDELQAFVGQDSFHGANQWVDYKTLDKQWQAFNRVYTIIYLPDQEETVKRILGENWDADKNREQALETSRLETEEDPENVFAWFNLGSNLVYFEEYAQAVRAFDTARELGWPQRMLRYQFSPFLAYFHALRNEELATLVEYALDRTPNSEEALLWKGWGLYRAGRKQEAIAAFQAALAAHPDYLDATYALNYVIAN